MICLDIRSAWARATIIHRLNDWGIGCCLDFLHVGLQPQRLWGGELDAGETFETFEDKRMIDTTAWKS